MTRKRPIVIVGALLLVLTYLLVQSRSADQPARTRAQRALQALQLSDDAINRAVLMTRSGLLLHYDLAPQAFREIQEQLQTLEGESALLADGGDFAMAHEARVLTDAIARKRRMVEDFTADNAVLRNSTTYFAHLVQELARDSWSQEARAVALEGCHVLMQYVQAPELTGLVRATAALESIAAARPDSEMSASLLAHGRAIVTLLPLVDRELRGILNVPVGVHAASVQRALLSSAQAAERRAQRFRLGLYIAASALLVYLALLFVRLRAKAAELRRKEIQLIQANKMTALGTLVSSVAHEINNPNQVVLTNAGVLTAALDDMVDALDTCRATRDGPVVAGLPYAEMRTTLPRLVRDTEESARRIEQIVADLKNFARPGGRPSDLFDVNDVVRRALRLLTHVIQKRTDALRVELADSLPLVRGNSQQIEQVAVNLIVNALEALATPQAGVTVLTRYDAQLDAVLLEIHDEGVGIPRENLGKIGEAFFTTKAAAGGTGLGVAIASSLVRLHDGQLAFASQPGKGTCATMILPARSARMLGPHAA